MSNTKWTKGEWAVRENSSGSYDVIPKGSDNGSGWRGSEYLCIYVASARGTRGSCTNNPTVIANANLIAAAPDMYEALDKMVVHINGSGKASAEDLNQAAKALAKARGES